VLIFGSLLTLKGLGANASGNWVNHKMGQRAG
jgi:hypothetical protein